MLSATITPTDLSPAKNPVYWKLLSTNTTAAYVLVIPTLDGVDYPALQFPKAPDGYFYVDISASIMARFADKAAADQWFLPDVGLNINQDRSSLLSKFSINCYEILISGTSVINHYTIAGGPILDYSSTGNPYAIRAVRQHRQLPNLDAYKATADNRFLTNMPDKGVIIPGMPHYLYYYLPADCSNAFLDISYIKNISGIFTSGSLSIPLGVMPRGLYCLPVGTDVINHFSGLPFVSVTNGVTTFSVAITDGTINLTELRTFKPDYSGPKMQMHFLWQNPFGVYDTYTFTGSTETSEKITTLSNYRRESLATDYRQRGYRTLSAIESNPTIVNSDFTTPEIVAWLDELRRSTDVFLLSTLESGSLEWLPVIITSSIYPASVTLPEISFEFIMAEDLVS